MVDLSDFIDPEDEPEDESEGEAEDLAALKLCLKALADAIASTNLAVLNEAQGDPAAATQRVHASVAALKRFHEAFQVLDRSETPPEPDIDED